MAFLDTVLEPPSYGWQNEQGELVKPTNGQIIREFFKRTNVFRNKKNWLSFIAWVQLFTLLPFFIVFVTMYFSWPLLAVGFIYSMVLMGTHGTIWYHRYSTHKAYTFRNSFWRFITQHLVIKVVPEETYVVSHHVHHAKSDQPGDPYNANCGFLYCFLADTNHQPINRNMTPEDYERAQKLMLHTGVKTNSYAKYQKWGSLITPLSFMTSWILNWGFWFAAFALLGKYVFHLHLLALPTAMFGAAFFWAAGVRTFNYEGHGKGVDKRAEGVDFNWDDMSINQVWPGYVAGEWHNNHHLFPRSARTGFLKYQLDLAWCYIKLLHILGGVIEYKDSKKQFMKEYHEPYLQQKALQGKGHVKKYNRTKEQMEEYNV